MINKFGAEVHLRVLFCVCVWGGGGGGGGGEAIDVALEGKIKVKSKIFPFDQYTKCISTT